MNLVLDAVGWAGSILLVISLLQADMRRLRILNLTASLILTAYNLALPVWPMVAVNAAVAIINVRYLTSRRRPSIGASPATARRTKEAP